MKRGVCRLIHYFLEQSKTLGLYVFRSIMFASLIACTSNVGWLTKHKSSKLETKSHLYITFVICLSDSCQTASEVSPGVKLYLQDKFGFWGSTGLSFIMANLCMAHLNILDKFTPSPSFSFQLINHLNSIRFQVFNVHLSLREIRTSKNNSIVNLS